MSTENRIEELPASDALLAKEDRERPAPQRAPPGEPDEPEEARSGIPPAPRAPDPID